MNITNREKIAIIGGDIRQLYCGEYLSDLGYEVCVYGFDKCGKDMKVTKCLNYKDALSNSKAVILPLPVSRDGATLFMALSDENIKLSDIINQTDKDTLILCGMLNEELKNSNYFKDKRIIDYYSREELKIANAYLTAESAVAMAMNESDKSIKDKKCLVVGYGRIGKMLCSVLKKLGAEVFASARKKNDLEWIRAYGYSAIESGKATDVIKECDIVFNTVPVKLIDKDFLSALPKDCIIIDLASSPGGVDFECAKELGIKTLWALGLPGKKLSYSAGLVLGKTIAGIFEEEGLFK